MESTKIDYLARLRGVVGYLGEREQFSWWPSSFFSAGSQAFLAPIFPKTQFLAQCTGVTRAAAAVHDERIGTGYVYHLFRLPEDMEQDIHQRLHSSELAQDILNLIADQDTALNFLCRSVSVEPSVDGGPVRLAGIGALRDLPQWTAACGYYAHGFTQGIQVFPYFADHS